MTQNLFSNFIGLTDSYKVSHADQLEAGTTDIYSFFESRGGKFSEVVFFGLQYYLKQYLEGIVIKKADIDDAAEDFALHFGNTDIFNRAGWEYIVERHGGRLPIQINAVPEGTVVPTGNVLMTVYNTDPKVPWITNYVETLLSQIWYPSTVATQSREMKKLILASLRKTGDPDTIPFKLHDFGFRGSTSVEAAALGGAAHLVNFQGTDTLAALQVTRRIYGERMAGFSVPAAEHSTITSWGRQREAEAFRNMLEKFPTGLVSVVSDSYDIYAACRDLWGSKLKEQVLNRDGVLVVRPDSGNPSEVVVKVLEILGDQFGFEANQKGYKVLNPKVRVIQGDGIDYGSLGNVLTAMETAGWSADNVAFGSGGGLLQKVNRDTQRFAFKCSATKIGGVWRDVIKNPITDPGKKSKAGRLALVNRAGVYQTVLEKDAGSDNLLQPVFRNGVVLQEQSLADIRTRAAL
jgi:nicotinamide phosphoribosyltransferase